MNVYQNGTKYSDTLKALEVESGNIRLHPCLNLNLVSAYGGYPAISLHETADSLITELLGYKIDAPAIDDAPPSLPAGSLLLSSPTGEKAKKALAETLGHECANSRWSPPATTCHRLPVSINPSTPKPPVSHSKAIKSLGYLYQENAL